MCHWNSSAVNCAQWVVCTVFCARRFVYLPFPVFLENYVIPEIQANFVPMSYMLAAEYPGIAVRTTDRLSCKTPNQLYVSIGHHSSLAKSESIVAPNRSASPTISATQIVPQTLDTTYSSTPVTRTIHDASTQLQWLQLPHTFYSVALFTTPKRLTNDSSLIIQYNRVTWLFGLNEQLLSTFSSYTTTGILSVPGNNSMPNRFLVHKTQKIMCIECTMLCNNRSEIYFCS